MRSACIALAVLALVLAIDQAATADSPGTKVILPGGTTITFQVTDKVSSGTAKVGDTFGLRVTEDVVVDGWVVIAKGAGGEGEVLKVDPAGPHGHAGSLGIQLDWVFAVDGNKVKLTNEQKTEEGVNKAGASSTATIVSYIFLGPIGFFAHNFVKGRDVELNPDNTAEHPLSAYVDSSVYVTAQTKAEQGFESPVPVGSPVPVPSVHSQ